jgi:uncharacterized damage-inducible protein DinB
MQISDVVMLAEYNHGANERVMRRVVPLLPSELHAPCSLSHGSLFQTLLHVVDAQWYWRLACETGEAPARSLSESDVSGAPELRELMRQEDARWIEFVRSIPEDKLVRPHSFHWAHAKPRTQLLWVLLMHAFNHGTHHQAEAGLRLGELGRPPGDIDFLIYASRSRS